MENNKNITKKKKSEQRKMQKKVTVRLDNETYDFIAEQAKIHNVSKATFMRDMTLMNKPKQSAVKQLSRDETQKLFDELVRLTNECNAVQNELNRIGNNINQVVKIAHSNKENWENYRNQIVNSLSDYSGQLDNYLSEKWSLFEVHK